MTKKIKVYMGTISNGTRVDSQDYVIRELQERYGDRVELVFPPVLVHRIFHDAARNGVVQEFLDTDCDVLWFLDSDVTPPKHVLDLITCHWDAWECAGAPYPIFMSPGAAGDTRQIVFTAYKDYGTGLKPGPVPYEGTEFVDGLATGCLFIKRSVFEKLERPYFEFKFDPMTRAPVEGEDLGFCLKVRKLGIKFFTDYSMVCRHQKSVDLLELNNYAIDYAQKAVAAYDQNARANLAATVAELRAKMRPTPPKAKSTLILPPGLGSPSSG